MWSSELAAEQLMRFSRVTGGKCEAGTESPAGFPYENIGLCFQVVRL